MELMFFMLFWIILNKFHDEDNMPAAMKNNVNVFICESHIIIIIICFHICASQGYLFVIFPPLWRQLKIRS